MKRNIPDIYDFASQKKISARRVMDFTNSANPLGPSSHARDAIRKSIKMIDRPVDDRARYLVRAIARLTMCRKKISLCQAVLMRCWPRSSGPLMQGASVLLPPIPHITGNSWKARSISIFWTLKKRDHFIFDRQLWESTIA